MEKNADKRAQEVHTLRLLNRLNIFNAAITGLFISRHSPPKITLTGLNLKSRRGLTSLFNQVSTPFKLKNNPVTAALNYLIDSAQIQANTDKREQTQNLRSGGRGCLGEGCLGLPG